VGVDPVHGGAHRMTSGAFFDQNTGCFDLVFVDGLHLREQVVRDVENAARWLNPGGCIVLHDCLPTRREQQLRTQPGGGRPWTGDVWKAVVDLRQRPEFDIAVLDDDWGAGRAVREAELGPSGASAGVGVGGFRRSMRPAAADRGRRHDGGVRGRYEVGVKGPSPPGARP
jgi:hypothetical protein